MVDPVVAWFIGQIAISLILGHYISACVVSYFWRRLEIETKNSKKSKKIINFRYSSERWHPILIGFLERFMYTTAVLLGRPEFVGVWLLFKVAVTWRLATQERCVYNIFIIGNAISLIFGVGGALLIQYLIRGKLGF